MLLVWLSGEPSAEAGNGPESKGIEYGGRAAGEVAGERRRVGRTTQERSDKE